MSATISTVRPAPDALLCELADYVLSAPAFSDEAYDTARHCLMDSLGCGILALSYSACTKLLGPIVPGRRQNPQPLLKQLEARITRRLREPIGSFETIESRSEVEDAATDFEVVTVEDLLRGLDGGHGGLPGRQLQFLGWGGGNQGEWSVVG